MPLEDKTIPYEILIRFNDEGAPQGAHVRSRRRVVLDGEVLKDDILDAVPLSLDGFAGSDLMTESTQSALVLVQTLTANLAAANARIAELESAPAV